MLFKHLLKHTYIASSFDKEDMYLFIIQSKQTSIPLLAFILYFIKTHFFYSNFQTILFRVEVSCLFWTSSEKQAEHFPFSLCCVTVFFVFYFWYNWNHICFCFFFFLCSDHTSTLGYISYENIGFYELVSWSTHLWKM